MMNLNFQNVTWEKTIVDNMYKFINNIIEDKNPDVTGVAKHYFELFNTGNPIQHALKGRTIYSMQVLRDDRMCTFSVVKTSINEYNPRDSITGTNAVCESMDENGNMYYMFELPFSNELKTTELCGVFHQMMGMIQCMLSFFNNNYKNRLSSELIKTSLSLYLTSYIIIKKATNMNQEIYRDMNKFSEDAFFYEFQVNDKYYTDIVKQSRPIDNIPGIVEFTLSHLVDGSYVSKYNKYKQISGCLNTAYRYAKSDEISNDAESLDYFNQFYKFLNQIPIKSHSDLRTELITEFKKRNRRSFGNKLDMSPIRIFEFTSDKTEKRFVYSLMIDNSNPIFGNKHFCEANDTVYYLAIGSDHNIKGKNYDEQEENFLDLVALARQLMLLYLSHYTTNSQDAIQLIAIAMALVVMIKRGMLDKDVFIGYSIHDVRVEKYYELNESLYDYIKYNMDEVNPFTKESVDFITKNATLLEDEDDEEDF